MPFADRQNTTGNIETCPLCGGISYSFHADKKRDYLRCGGCALVFVPPGQHLGAAEEKAVYDLHRNGPEDAGYRRFLSRLLEPLCLRLKPGDKGLDFGCGPGPTLSVMLAERGYETDLYDPYYADDRTVLDRRYDFIACTETAEHFREPGREFDLLMKLLEPGGLLGLMTKLVTDREAFARWHYKNDPTHICYFSRETFSMLAARHDCELEIIGGDVILMNKVTVSGGG
ncbi:MAG: class I SAM-dependent methyltransferase [Gammaproteobacteria bacterium]